MISLPGLVFTYTSSLFQPLPMASGTNLVALLRVRESVMNRKHFPALRLLPTRNKSLSSKAKCLTNGISASKLSSLEYISQALGFESRPDTCIRILIICVLWQEVWRCVIIQLCAQLFADVASGVPPTLFLLRVSVSLDCLVHSMLPTPGFYT